MLVPSPEAKRWVNIYPKRNPEKRYTNYRFLPEGYFPDIDGEVDIYEDKVMIALISQPKRLGIMITSSHFANILKAMFEMAWVQTGFNKGKR